MPSYIPNKPSNCTWNLAHDKQASHHHHASLPCTKPQIYDNVMEYIGNTPLVRLNNISKKYGLECELLAKCEFLNPGGSVKDRIGYRMVKEAQREGRLQPGTTVIEPTSGNTGVSIAMASAIHGYNCIIVIPEKMSKEKVSVLKGLGAKVIRTRTSARYYEQDSLFQISARLQEQIENAVILDQYKNPYNPIAHYDATAEEILRDCGGDVDAIVIGAGTGGTLAGIARKIKEKLPSCKICAVDPYGSSLAGELTSRDKAVSFYEVEGIGYDFIPTVLDRDPVDQWIKTADKESLNVARELIQLEGLLCGGSSGAAVYAAIQMAKTLKKGQKCVVILPDSIRNYLSKFLDDSWMIERDFMDCIPTNKASKGWWDESIAKMPIKKTITFSPSHTLPQAISILNGSKTNLFAVLDEASKVVGVVSIDDIFNIYINSEDKDHKLVSNIMKTNFYPIFSTKSTLGKTYHSLSASQEAIIVISPDNFEYVGNVSKHDLLAYIKELKV